MTRNEKMVLVSLLIRRWFDISEEDHKKAMSRLVSKGYVRRSRAGTSVRHKHNIVQLTESGMAKAAACVREFKVPVVGRPYMRLASRKRQKILFKHDLYGKTVPA